MTLEIEVAAKGTPMLKAVYESSSSPAGYERDKGGYGVCVLHKSIEWKMMVKLGLEEDYMTQVLTHEQLHDCIYQIYLRYVRKRLRNPSRERLMHKGDICALLGF